MTSDHHSDRDAGTVYADDVSATYSTHLKPTSLAGGRVLDVGAGGRYEVAYRFLEEGAQEVVCVDPYVAPPCEHPSVRVIGSDVVGAARRLEPESFDAVVSWVVLQEINDLGAALDAMDRLLRPEGVMVHKVDLLGYSALTNRLLRGHPLGFLAVPERLYARGAEGRRPNRERLGRYRRELTARRYEVDAIVEQVSGRDVRSAGKRRLAEFRFDDADIRRAERARRWLRPGFRELPIEDLLVTNAVLVAEKPAVRATPIEPASATAQATSARSKP